MNIAYLKSARPGSRGRIPGLALLALALAAAPACDDDEDVPSVNNGGSGGAKDGGVDAAGGTGGSVTDGAVDVVAEAGGEVSGDTTTSDTGTDAGTDAGQVIAVDTDLALVRFNANGMLDTTFGAAGIVRLDLSTAPGTAMNNVRDSMWGMTRDTTDRLLLFASKKATGRLDQDRVVVRLTAAGVKDATFGTAGEATLDIMNLGDNPRNGFVQGDGKILTAGYTPQPTGVGAQVANKVVLQRLLDNGMPDPAFGAAGVVNSLPFAPPNPTAEVGMAEAYGAALQGDKYVTTGYGRSLPAGQVDMVSFRYSAAGVLDTTWGSNGIVTLDVLGGNDRGRNIIGLPDGRVVIAGTGTRTTDVEDAMLAIYGANGAPDTTLGPMGYKLFEFGGTDEEFYGLALSPNNMTVGAAGYRVLAANDDDSTLVLLPLAAGGTAIEKTVALSETANDRLWAVTFDANNKAVATGFVTEGTDNFMVVARFNADGTLDATFGTAGVTKVNVSVGKTEEGARGVVVQSDGKIVIAGVVEHM